MQQFATDQSLPSSRAVPADNLNQMVDDLFTTMLDMPVNASTEHAMQNADAIQASVCINGDWEAVLLVVASKEFASQAAQAMFGIEPQDLTETEILDALGEVANIIGGNAKGIVNKDCSLSLPCVRGYVSEEIHPAATKMSYEFQGEPFQVLLTEH